MLVPLVIMNCAGVGPSAIAVGGPDGTANLRRGALAAPGVPSNTSTRPVTPKVSITKRVGEVLVVLSSAIPTGVESVVASPAMARVGGVLPAALRGL